MGMEIPLLEIIYPIFKQQTTHRKTERKPMTKQDEIETLRKTAEKLGANSYCGPWLLDQLPQIEQDIRSDYFPQITWAESRRIQDQHIANAKAQAEFMLKQAKEKAERMIQDAEKHSKQVRASLIRDMEKVIASL